MQMKKFISFFLLIHFTLITFVNSTETVTKTQNGKIKAWRLSRDLNKIIPVNIDTGLLGIQITNPVFKRTLSASYLGNTGLPAISDLFIDRIYFTENIFKNNVSYYFHTPENIVFYNTTRPYTRVGFTTAGPQRKNEKILSVLHTQNVNPGFNIGLLYDNISSDGHFNRQTAKTNALSFFSNLKINRYLFHAKASINSIQAFENGGLLNVEDIRQADLGTEDLPVKLSNARTALRNSSLLFIHKFQLFGKTLNDSLVTIEPMTLPGMRIGHIFHFNSFQRGFYDIIVPNQDFYPDFFIDYTQTNDSVYLRTLRNDFFLEMPELRINKFSFSAEAGISHELFATGYSIIPDSTFVYDNVQPVDTIVTTFRENNFSNYSVFGSATTSLTNRITLTAALKYHFAGFRNNDFEFVAGGIFRIPLLGREFIIEPELKQLFYTPSYFQQRFSSNHFIWNNNFRQIKKSSLGGEFIIPDLQLKAGVRLFLINDFVFFNRDAVPEQYDHGLEIITATLENNFSFWRINVRSRLAFQQSSNNHVIHLPTFVSYHSLSFTQPLFKNALTMQVGFDIYYNSPYFVPAYQPATGQFYIQEERKYGGYPFMDAFLNFSIRRTRLFIKIEHFNASFFNHNYFTVLNYPRNGLVSRFGLIWNFYD